MDELPVARGAETLLDVPTEPERRRWSTQFASRPGATVEYEDGRHEVSATDTLVLELRGLEGASDRHDTLAVAALERPNCGRRRSLASNDGAVAPEQDADVLLALGSAA